MWTSKQKKSNEHMYLKCITDNYFKKIIFFREESIFSHYLSQNKAITYFKGILCYTAIQF